MKAWQVACRRCGVNSKAGRSPFCISCKKINRKEAVERSMAKRGTLIAECRHCGMIQDDVEPQELLDQLREVAKALKQNNQEIV